MSVLAPWETAEAERRKHERVIAEAEKVAYTIDTYGYTLLETALRDRLEAEKRSILKGSMDVDEYHRACGYVAGLEYALSRPDMFLKKARPLGDADA